MAPDTLSLAGKVAIVTGSGREHGLGAGIARALARNGAKVTINYISESTTPQAAAVAEKIRDAGGEVTVVRADISTQEGAATLIRETLAAFGTGKIDILVNNAFGGRPSSLLRADKEVLDLSFGTPVYGPFLMIQAVVPFMPRGGRIVNIGSVASKLAPADITVYAAAKAAMDALTYAAAKELGRGYGITINTVMPGPVDTGAFKGSAADALHGFLKTLTRAEDRLGTVEDMADAVLLLTAEQSRWITGQTISVSGGITGN